MTVKPRITREAPHMWVVSTPYSRYVSHTWQMAMSVANNIAAFNRWDSERIKNVTRHLRKP